MLQEVLQHVHLELIKNSAGFSLKHSYGEVVLVFKQVPLSMLLS